MTAIVKMEFADIVEGDALLMPAKEAAPLDGDLAGIRIKEKTQVAEESEDEGNADDGGEGDARECGEDGADGEAGGDAVEMDAPVCVEPSLGSDGHGEPEHEKADQEHGNPDPQREAEFVENAAGNFGLRIAEFGILGGGTHGAAKEYSAWAATRRYCGLFACRGSG